MEIESQNRHEIENSLWNYIHVDEYAQGFQRLEDLLNELPEPEIFLWQCFHDTCKSLHDLCFLAISGGRDDIVSWVESVGESIALWPMDLWDRLEKSATGMAKLPPLDDSDFPLWREGANVYGFDWDNTAFVPASVSSRLLEDFCLDRMKFLEKNTREFETVYFPDWKHVPSTVPTCEEISKNTVLVELQQDQARSFMQYNPLKFGINPDMRSVFSWKSRAEFAFWVESYVELLQQIPWIGFVAAGEPSVLVLCYHKGKMESARNLSLALQKKGTPHFLIHSEKGCFVQEAFCGSVDVGIFP